MKFPMQRWFTLLLILLAPLVAAQEKRQVKLRAICFQHVDGIKQVLAVSGGEGDRSAVAVDLFTTAISDEVEAVVENGLLTFAVPGEAEGSFKTIATVKAVAGPRQLAIFIPGEEGKSPYRCFVIDDSLKNFPMGSTMAVNLSAVPFRYSIGEHQRAVNPGKIESIPMALKANERGQVSVIIAVADAAAEGGWRAVNQTRWFTGRDKRDLAIGFMHPQTGQPTVNCYADTPPFAN